MTPVVDEQKKQALREARSCPEIAALLEGTSLADLSAREVLLVHRSVERVDADPDLRVAYLANHVVDPLPRYAEVGAALEGLRLASYVGPFDQPFQEVLDPGSGLAAFDPDVVLLELSLRRLAPRVFDGFLSLTGDERVKEREQVLHSVLDWVQAARERTRATLLVANFPRPAFGQGGIADANSEYSEAEFYADLNLELLRALRPDPRAHRFDLDRVVGRVGALGAHDPKLYHLAKMQWSEACVPHVAEELLRYAKAIRGQTRKCLVLDLDNTLWGGVVGEDGPMGVRVGEGDAVGEAFLAFQRAIRSLVDRGIVLAVCSKNNPEDVAEVFEQRPEMALSLGDFAAKRINWEPKHQNIESIARELNIGVDSLVFVDDNPVECELVRQMLPAVKTIHLPADPATYAPLIERAADFEKLSLTDEDLVKSERYRDNSQREAYREKVGDLNAFLERLGTQVSIGRAQAHHVARVQQLFSKTNQFNVTTKRYGLGDVEGFVADPSRELGVMQVADSFGDLGLVGVFLIELHDDRAVIDSFLMSCRVMGRGVETALMNWIKRSTLLSGRVSRLEAEYAPTRKNQPVAAFFEAQGFSVRERDDDGRTRYVLESADASLHECVGITENELEAKDEGRG